MHIISGLNSGFFFLEYYRENVALAATCNNTGQTAGWFIGNVVFLIFQSPEFSNRYIRKILNLQSQTYGLIPIHSIQKYELFY